VAKFETTGSINNQPTPVRSRNARPAENIAAVRKSVQQNSRQSIPRRAQELGLSQTSIWRILRRDLGLHPYKVKLTQKLNDHNHRLRRLFIQRTATFDILHERFERKVIFRKSDVNFSPRSCDLNPLDFFFWGFFKSQVYTNKPQSTDAMKVNITQAMAQIQSGLCGRVIENWTTRIRATV
jgi:hypothetical protein